MVMPAGSFAQSGTTPLLERQLTLTLDQERLETALKKIATAGGFSFSYNPSILDGNRVVSHQFNHKSVREILDVLFKGSIQYKERSKYIILTKAESSSNKDTKLLSGYVIDEATGQRLKNVSVYDPVSLSSAVTDAYGYFQIEIDNPSSEDIKLAVNKRNYTDTLVVVPHDDPQLLNIPIRINTEKLATLADSVGSKLKRFWLVTKKATAQAVNMENINDTLNRDTQVSFVPFVGTNGALSGNVINDYSLNILGGYSLGTRKVEFGGLFNAVRGDVDGFQAAGIFNAVGGNRRGVQFAGMFNAAAGSSHGAQFAGLFNFNWAGSNGVAGAGLFNYSHANARAVTFAGLGNFTLGQHEGPQLAGLFNFALRDARPAQLAGLLNFTGGTMTGTQLSGLVNYSTHLTGSQLAGILNVVSGTVRGSQVAGLVNYGTTVHGSQVGLLNICDSIQGIPVGLLSIVGKGYHKIEISADEIFYNNIAFRTGVRQFYNIIFAGAQPQTYGRSQTTWTFGYGLGTAPRLNRWLSLNIDLTSQQVVSGGKIEGPNVINKLTIGTDFQTSKHFSIATGLTLNGYWSDLDKQQPTLFNDYTPHFFGSHTSSQNISRQFWLGAKVAIRFL